MEPWYRPSVFELSDFLGLVGFLRVVFGHVYRLHTEVRHKLRPIFARGGLLVFELRVFRYLDKRAFEEVGNDAGICTMGGYCRRAFAELTFRGEQRLAQAIIGTVGNGESRVGVATEPRLYHGVEVKNIVLLAVRHEVDRRDVYRKVQKEVALADVTVEHRLVIVFEERFYFERYTLFLCDCLARVVGGDDADIFSINADVAEYQRQHALPDASKSNDE